MVTDTWINVEDGDEIEVYDTVTPIISFTFSKESRIKLSCDDTWFLEKMYHALEVYLREANLKR